jgi:lipopolysaccharide/colanic/teichoic acid biosynthesis glycosyltransferase
MKITSNVSNETFSSISTNNPLNICFIVTTPFAVNGFLINHLNRLANSYHITLCLNLDLYPLSLELDSEKIRIINIPIERKTKLLNDLHCLWMLVKFFRISQLDVIHSVTPKAGLLGMLAGYICGVPMRFHTFTGQIWVNYSGIKKIFFKKIDWIIAHLATQVFADSSSQMQYLINQGICKQYKISLLGPGSISGVDLQKFYFDPQTRQKIRSQYGAVDSTCIFLFVGRLTKDKGVLDLIRAYTLLLSDDAGISAALWIAGPDEEGIELLARQLPGVEDLNICWLGSTMRPQDFMTAADVLVLPSYREGFGSVIIEAGTCRMPTIAYQIDGVIDAIQSEKTGLFCDCGNIRSLSEIMHKLLVDEKLRIKLGEAAATFSRKHFSSDIITSAWLNFYSKIKRPEKNKSYFLKRLFDLALSLLLIPLMAIPIFTISFCIWLESDSPVLFWSKRVGKNGQLFSMPKFRSMKISAPVVATHLLDEPAAHLTKVGKFLRKSSLDEVPQIWSILKGDMSYVGPRPALFNQNDLIEQRKSLGIDQFRPGLTGWAQVNGRDEITLEKKIQLDAYYLHHQSFWFDLYIIWLTFVKVIRSENVSH